MNLHFNLLPKLLNDFLKYNIERTFIFKTFNRIFKEKENDMDTFLANMKSNYANTLSESCALIDSSFKMLSTRVNVNN
jgi:hypothetical protein